jgi:hypothetical protein
LEVSYLKSFQSPEPTIEKEEIKRENLLKSHEIYFVQKQLNSKQCDEIW